MEASTKFFPIVAALLVLLQSCIMTTVVDEIDGTVQGEQVYTSKAESSKEGSFVLHIGNDADNTMLRIDSLEICNVLVADPATGYVRSGSIMLYEWDRAAGEIAGGSGLTTDEVRVPVQTLEPWAPQESFSSGGHPVAGGGAYVKIFGSVCSFLQGNEVYTIYEGVMYYPLSGVVTEVAASPVSIILNEDCPLYAQIGGRMEKVLNPVAFSVSVEQWQWGN